MRLVSPDDDRIVIRRPRTGVTEVIGPRGRVVSANGPHALWSAEVGQSAISLTRPRRGSRALWSTSAGERFCPAETGGSGGALSLVSAKVCLESLAGRANLPWAAITVPQLRHRYASDLLPSVNLLVACPDQPAGQPLPAEKMRGDLPWTPKRPRRIIPAKLRTHSDGEMNAF